ncbi:MAG: hypothetical protein KGI67_15065 [Pseudomonadota bacterium]|nr:hypothetical protein [Pseudomonadota bacterium]
MKPDSAPSQPRRWLILSHGFNMDGRAASLTVTDKIPHLMHAGIEPIVISAVTGARDQRFPHYQILPWGPAGLRFDLRHSIAQRWGRGVVYRITTGLISLLLALPILLERLLLGWQQYWSWMPAAVFRGWLCIRRFRPELIYTSGGAYSAHWAGYWLARLTGLPWIAEVHDPMVFPGSSPRTRNQKRWARIEAMICSRATLAWWFTDEALAGARRRHPELGARGVVILPGAEPPAVRADYRPGAHCVLAHFGSLSDSRSLVPAIQALLRLRAAAVTGADAVVIDCYGGAIDASARRLIGEQGLGEVVRAHGRLEADPASGLSGRARIQALMHQADALLLVHGNTVECPEYIPSKFYDYLWAGRPVVALVHHNPQLSALVEAHGGYQAEVEDDAQVQAMLSRLLQDWRAGTLKRGPLPPIGVDRAVRELLEHLERD